MVKFATDAEARASGERVISIRSKLLTHLASLHNDTQGCMSVNRSTEFTSEELRQGKVNTKKEEKKREIEIEGTLYEVVWDGSGPSRWGGYTKGELMAPYQRRNHLTDNPKVG